eukprot:scaffold338882_cov20-Prasinocladus_malaysianus.AAC.1
MAAFAPCESMIYWTSMSSMLSHHAQHGTEALKRLQAHYVIAVTAGRIHWDSDTPSCALLKLP